jgi:hypothetical protein
VEFPANRLRGQLKLWGKRGYGLREVWVKRGSTVHSNGFKKAHIAHPFPDTSRDVSRYYKFKLPKIGMDCWCSGNVSSI